jgi:hypothetical protein
MSDNPNSSIPDSNYFNSIQNNSFSQIIGEHEINYPNNIDDTRINFSEKRVKDL